ncbi:hypothetical protein LJC60_07520, partial [Ruminococcaceae bacterium OttesenSCG-928-D13]|nr:hypothetical protein [Ruminococcaceae bacterium OttesenSCG-928-D13]
MGAGTRFKSKKTGRAPGAEGRMRVWRWVFYALALLAVSFAFAAERAATASYNPVNGDFQSYNVFRRILAGQLPVRDFANYVGMAPILLNLPLLALGGGGFTASLFVTNFTCNVLFSLCV